MKKWLFYSVSGLIAATLFQAQSAQAAEAADTGATIQEVIVTAQRFTQSAQKTPLAITVVDAKHLSGVNDVTQLQTLVPGVVISDVNGVNQAYIRGIGSANALPSQESSVAYNQDGVILFTTSMVSPLMFDLERVEILKGPQGTLYGRNASAGAINLITRDASLGGQNGYVEASAGNYNLARVTAAINVPLSDTLAVRLAAEHAQHDGYLSDGTDDQNQTAARLRLLWKPSSNVTLHLGLDGSDVDYKGGSASVSPNPTSERWIGACDPRLSTGPLAATYGVFASNPANACVNPPPSYKDRQWSAFGQLDVDMGFATLTVLPAYRNEKLDYVSYNNGYGGFNHFRTKQASFEARLSKHTDNFKWVVGAYYLDVDQPSTVIIDNSAAVSVINPTVNKWRSYAFFGEGTYSITPSTRLIGGLRYTNERTTNIGTVTNAPVLAFLGYSYPVNNKEEAKPTTWKVGVEQDLTPDSLLFFTVSRGFKGGGSYTAVPGVDSTFRPEFVTAYELGSRNQFFNHTLQVNAEAFYWKLEDQQIPYLGYDPVGNFNFITANAGAGHVQGVDVDVLWRATSSDTFHASAQYEQSKYDSFLRTVAPPTVIQPTLCKLTVSRAPNFAVVPPDLGKGTLDCAGLPLLRAPKWSGSASYEHRFDLENYGSLVAGVDTTFASSSYIDAVFTNLFKSASYALLNASLTYTPPKTPVTLTAWIKNVADQQVINGGGQTTNTYTRPTYLPPRTFGITARYEF